MTKKGEITMTLDELRGLADSIAADYEPRISRLERFANRLGRMIADMDNSRMVLTVEGEPEEGGPDDQSQGD